MRQFPIQLDTTSLRFLIQGARYTRAVHVAVFLSLADHLSEGPRQLNVLARETQTHAPSLKRLLRALVSIGIFSEQDDGLFANSELSELLRRDHPHSMHDLALLSGADWEWESWQDLLYSVKTGYSAFAHRYHMTLWEYFDAVDQKSGQIFDRGMANSTKRACQSIAQACTFSVGETCVDVGGGKGYLLEEILRLHPTIKGVLIDRPQVAEQARAYLTEQGLIDRCEIIGGDIFEEVQPGADVYLLKNILHNWDDAHCIQILTNCQKALPPHGRVVLAEYLVRPGMTGYHEKFLDLQMLVALEGREREEEEYRTLYAASGLAVTRVLPTSSGLYLIEGIVASNAP